MGLIGLEMIYKCAKNQGNTPLEQSIFSQQMKAKKVKQVLNKSGHQLDGKA
jgi:hypothetical protein